jgi:hypothetical protein
MNRAFFFLFLILIITTSEGNAQVKFRDGFIIKLNNDTVFGKISYRPSSDVCRLEVNDAISEYTPSQIHGFGYLTNKFFTSEIMENKFVELLVDGKLKLFKHDNLYLQKSSGQIFRLEKKEIEVERDGAKFISEDTQWKGIIISLTSDAEMDNQALQKLKFEENKIIEVVKDYDQRVGSKTTVYKEYNNNTRFNYGLQVGINQTALILNKNNNLYKYLDNKYTSTDPAFGVFCTVSLPFLSDKLALQAEVNYIKSTYSSRKILNDPSVKTYYDSYIQFSTIVIPVSLKYTLTEKKNSVFLMLGPSGNYNFNTTSITSIENVRDGIVTTTENNELLISKSQLGYWAGIEIRKPFKSFNIGATIRFQRVVKLNNLIDISAYCNRFSFSILISK